MAADAEVTSRFPAAAQALGTPQFAILLAAALSVAAAYGVTLPVLPFLVERIEGSGSAAVAKHTGMLTGVYTFALFMLSPIWGTLSDRIGRRPIIAVGLIGSAISLLLLDSAATLSALYAARISSGILSSAVLPAVLAYVAEASLDTERPRRFAIMASATTLGFLLGPPLGSWLAPMVLAPLAGMRVAGLLMADSPFFTVAMANLLAAIALAFLPESAQYRPARSATANAKSNTVDRRGVYSGLMLTCVAVFGISVAEVGITLLGKQVLSLNPQGIARFFLVCGGVMIAVQLVVFPICLRRFLLPSLVAICLLVAAAGLALIPYAKSVAGTMLAFAFVSVGTALLIPALATLISQAAGPLQGKVMGQQASAANLGQALAASLTGLLFLSAPAAPFMLGAIATATGVTFAIRMKKTRQTEKNGTG